MSKFPKSNYEFTRLLSPKQKKAFSICVASVKGMSINEAENVLFESLNAIKTCSAINVCKPEDKVYFNSLQVSSGD